MKRSALSWPEFCHWIQGRELISSHEMDGIVCLKFKDGSQATLVNDIEPGYDISEVTPGPCDTIMPTKITVDEMEGEK